MRPPHPSHCRRRLLFAGAALACAGPVAAQGLFGRRAAPELLPVDDALRVGPAMWRDGRLTVDVDVAPGTYLYRDRFVVEPLAAGIELTPHLPDGEWLDDPEFGRVQVWRGRVQVDFDSPVAPAHVQVRYQGCAEGRVCYTPQTRELPVVVTGR